MQVQILELAINFSFFYFYVCMGTLLVVAFRNSKTDFYTDGVVYG